MRDSQRQRVYDAECSTDMWINPDMKFSSLKELDDWVQHILASAWWRDRQMSDGYPAQVWVKDGRRRRRGQGGRLWRAGGAGYIKMPVWTRTKPYTLHEVAHAIDPQKRHGREFAVTYLLLVRRWLGEQCHDELKAAFKAGGVRFRPKRQIAPERRAALVAQCLAMRQAQSREAVCA